MNNFDILKTSIEEIINEFLKDNSSIFSNNYEKSQAYRIGLNKKPSNKECFYKGCKKKSIKKSHTIQEASLKIISENGNLLRPRFENLSTYKMEKIGVNSASCFPGFCKEHEALFHRFEKNKRIENNEDVILQLYRSVAREVVVNKHMLQSLQKSRKEYLLFRDEKFTELIKAKILIKGFNNSYYDIEKSKYKYSGSDNLINKYDHNIIKIENHLDGFLKEYHDSIFSYFCTKKTSIYVKQTCVDVVLPIAFSGFASIAVNFNGDDIRIELIINVIPYDNGSCMFLSTLEKNKVVLDKIYKLNNLDEGINMINALESFMVNDTDNWFIKPSIWNKLNFNIQNEILRDMVKEEPFISLDYKYGIFNDLRKSIIEYNECLPNISCRNRVLLNKEKAKII